MLDGYGRPDPSIEPHCCGTDDCDPWVHRWDRCPCCAYERSGLDTGGQWVRCHYHVKASHRAAKRRDFVRRFTVADTLTQVASKQMLMLTVTPPKTVVCEEGQLRDLIEWWRREMLETFAKLRATATWNKWVVLGGCYGYEPKLRPPGTWISCKKPRCKGRYQEGEQCEGKGHRDGKPYGRYSHPTMWEVHPHLHVACTVSTAYEDWNPQQTPRKIGDDLTEYTETHGLGYVQVNPPKKWKRYEDAVEQGVKYAVKYVLKGDDNEHQRRYAHYTGVFGYLYGIAATVTSTKKAHRILEAAGHDVKDPMGLAGLEALGGRSPPRPSED